MSARTVGVGGGVGGTIWLGAGWFTLLMLVLVLDVGAEVRMTRLSERVMTTRYGKVRGVLVEFPNRHLRTVEAYLGLRYADLNQGGLRFMPPKNPMEKWNGIRVAIEHQPVCPQRKLSDSEMQNSGPDGREGQIRNISSFLLKQTEDCLTLNIYVPIQEWNETSPFAVMVFVHGESYDTGTGNAYDGSVLASYGNVIVVTLNYRVGVLGFLATGDNSAMGNYAQLDIIQALHWLKENIVSFNGDPGRVTLFGHGHGAAIVNLILLSPFVQGHGPLFQNAIVQSGSALSTWAVSYDPVWCTQKLAVNVNCSRHISNSRALVKCLRERSWSELVNAVPLPPKYYSCFAPSIDGWSVLPKKVEDLMKKKQSKFAEAKVMFGITKNEAYSYLKQHEITKGISEFRKSQMIRTYVQNVFKYHRQKIYEILDHHYTDWNRMSDKLSKRNNILELLSDGQYVAPLIKAAQYHAETAETYLYAFSYSTQTEESLTENVHGIHGDELPYVFGAPLVGGISPFPATYTNAERMISEAVMTYWTNFAKTGDPNLPRNQTSLHGGRVKNRFVNIDWPKFDLENQQFLLIGGSDAPLCPGCGPSNNTTARRPTVRHHYRGQKLALWLDLIPKIDKPDGSDPSQHLLHNSDNSSSFDDYSRLIPSFENIFPSPPAMPPIAPTPWSIPKGGQWSTESNFPEETSDNVRNRALVQPPEGSTIIKGSNPFSLHNPEEQSTAVISPVDQSSDSSESSVPLSITVAVGCSLLFLNILIFAGVFYQRERIRKMKRRQQREDREEDPDEVKLSRKIEKENRTAAGAACVESVSLMSNPSSNQSPVKDNHSPQINSKSAIPGKQLPSLGYSYAVVPNQTSSPLHRSHGEPPYNNIPLTTFNPGDRPGGNTYVPAGNSRGHEPYTRTESDGTTYKVINKTGDPGGSNNAITIV
ncbi:neuroligin-4, X-linked isoform X2 [Patella vulgata]|uniref:neuroligin-4, X-linked isoform X2 n=1 Tax=Patella vulgata TaxID=6465 RepID=UPI00217FD9DA|nr:neuroligin-4, X-linked isoform X2 [Patella vulgata]